MMALLAGMMYVVLHQEVARKTGRFAPGAIKSFKTSMYARQ
jgi:hypothetical protein